jgi:hypothetical protein
VKCGNMGFMSFDRLLWEGANTRFAQAGGAI